MVYKPDIPGINDNLKISQADLLANFQAIDTVLKVNHSEFNADTQGKHLKAVLPVVVDDEEPDVNECSLFTKMVTVYTTPAITVDRPELFLVKGDGAAVQITGGGNVSNNIALDQPLMESGWTRLPNGILIKWCGGFHVTGIDYSYVDIAFAPDITGPAFTLGACVYGAIRLPGVAENKTVYPASFDLATQAVRFLCGTRYGASADITDFYIDCFVIGV